MLPFNQLFEMAKSIQQGQGAEVVDTTESPTFDAAWQIYTSMAAKNPQFYSNIWSSAVAFALTEGTRTLDIQAVRDASRFVAMSYIASAHYAVEIVLDTPQHQLQEELNKEIASKIKFIDHIAYKVTLSLNAQLRDVRQKGGLNATLDQGMKLVLGEFYSLCIYAQRELRSNAYQSIREETAETVINHMHAINDFGLPLFLNRDDRARLAEFGDSVATLPVRPGIAITAVEHGEGGKVIQLGQRLKRANRAPE